MTLIEVTIREAGSRGEGIGIAICEYAHAVLCNGFGQYEEAFAAARSATDDRELVVPNWGMSELIESATRTGQVRSGGGRLEPARGEGTGERDRLGARDRAPVASPAE